MSITQDDFKKIWASTSSVPEYTFSDADYQDGWEFVGNLPPTRAMWDTLQRRNDQKMKYLQDNGSMCFDSVADMVATDLDEGQTVFTKGYHSVNDGGSAIYTIRAKDVADVDDGGSIIFLDNENVAELIADDVANVKQFGAKGDGTTNDTTAVQNAVNFSQYVMFPQGTYLLGTVNITRDTTVYSDVGTTIKLDYSGNGKTFANVFQATNCDLTVKGFSFVGTVQPNPVLGSYALPTVITGSNGKISVLECGFKDVQFTQTVSVGSVFVNQIGSLLHTGDCDVVFRDIKIINCYGELTNNHYSAEDVDDVVNDVVYENIYMDNNTGSLNPMARNLIVKNIKGSHTTYNGSIMNAFGLKNTYMEDLDVASNAPQPFDTTEGGLILCENVKVVNVATPTKVYCENLVAINSTVAVSRVNRQDSAWSPFSVKSNPSKCNIIAEQSEVYASEGMGQSLSVGDVPVNWFFQNCTLEKQSFIGNVTIREVYITCVNCKVYPGQFSLGANTYINCEIVNEFAPGFSAYVFGDANKTDWVAKTDEYVRFIGCWCLSPFTLYKAWLDNVQYDAYKLQACDNITDPWA